MKEFSSESVILYNIGLDGIRVSLKVSGEVLYYFI